MCLNLSTAPGQRSSPPYPKKTLLPEIQSHPAAPKSRRPNVRSREYALKVVEVQLVSEVLDVHCELNADSLFSTEIDPSGKIQNRPGFDSAALKINFIKEAGIESLADKLLQRDAGFHVHRNSRVVAAAKGSPPTGPLVCVADLELPFVPLVMVIRKPEAGRNQRIHGFPEKQPADDRSYAK